MSGLRFGATVAEARELVGATVEAVEQEGDDRYRVKLALVDGRVMEGVLTEADYRALLFGGIPIVETDEAPGGKSEG